jgi:hypothetical protein
MVEIDVPVPQDVGAAVSSVAEHLGLTIASDGRLKSYPGSRHWHLKKPGKSGTLEITFWPAKERFWVTYHSNRIGDGWVEELAPIFAEYLRKQAV